MIAQALFFYQFNSVKNRLLMRVRRMKQPRYLVGGIAGALYFYFYFYRALHRGFSATPALSMTAHRPFFESVFALGFFAVLLLMWIFPHARAALTFTEAEVAFLFPAPVSRRDLINFKLLRLQTAILISSFFMAVFGRFGSPHFYSGWVGWCLILAVFNLHLIGSSFGVTMMMDHGISTWRRRTIFVGVIVASLAGLALWLHATFPPPPAVEANREAIPILTHYFTHALDAGPLHYLLYPFHILLAPFFAQNPTEFLLALPGALAIVALHYLWVIGSNVAFEEASIDASRRQAERVAAMRAGNWQPGRKNRKASRSPFRLNASGFPATALIWKNLIAAGNMVTMRFWIMLVWLLVFGGFMFRANLHSGVNMAVTMLIGMLLAFSVLIGPNLLRNDFRQDLPMTDLLKTLPLAGWQIALGEILAPVLIIVAAQWLLLILALIFCPPDINHHPINLTLRLAIFSGSALVLPALDFANLLIRNLAVLTFPSWFQLGRDGPRGFENTGQQLILVFGQILALALALAPPAFAFAALWFSASLLVAPAFAVIAASVAALAILVVETVLAVRWVGNFFERLDLSSELLTPE